MEMHCADGSPLKVEFGVAVLFLRSSAAQEQRQYLYQQWTDTPLARYPSPF